MSNDAKIEPALTPEEWAEVREGGALTFLSDESLRVIDAGDGIKFVLANDDHAPDWAEVDSWDTAGIVGLAALLLNALPDGHPLKLTRADVLLIREAVADLGDYGEPAMCKRLLNLAAKIEALLPPE